jgi:hypothetical protein
MFQYRELDTIFGDPHDDQACGPGDSGILDVHSGDGCPTIGDNTIVWVALGGNGI